MTLTTNLAPTFATALTSQPWMRHVIGQLDDPVGRGAGLVGVDIGHVDMPGLVMSEVCVGFVMRDGRIHATGTQFQHVEAEKFCRVQDLVTASIVPSRMTHWALCDKSPQSTPWCSATSPSYTRSMPFIRRRRARHRSGRALS